MSSFAQKESVREQLSAAEETFRLCEGTIVQNENEELCGQRRLLDITWNPQLQLHVAVPPQNHGLEEEDLCSQQLNIKVEQEEPEETKEEQEPLQIKEEQEEQEPPQVKIQRGSTTKFCISCKAGIAVATKTCKICKMEQPQKLRGTKMLERFKAKKERWLQSQKKNGQSLRVLDEASVLVEKFHTLGYKAVVFAARPGRIPSKWRTHVIHPRWQLADPVGKFLDQMKVSFELMITGWTNQQLSSTPDIQPSTSPAIPPSVLTITQDPAYVPVKKKKRRNKKEESSEECSHTIGGKDQCYRVKQVLRTKSQKGKLMEFVEWEPCAVCGKTWSPQWVKKRHTKK